MSQDRSGDWVVQNHGADADELRGALAILEQELKGGPTERIIAALGEIVLLSNRPPSMGDAEAKGYLHAMGRVLLDYPIDIVEDACARWRKTPSKGSWWPMEADIRSLCDKEFAHRKRLRLQMQGMLLREEARTQHAQSASTAPRSEAQRLFQEGFASRLTPAQAEAFADKYVMKFQGEDTILVKYPVQLDAIRIEARDIQKAQGVRVILAPEAFAGDPPKPVREATPEEKAALAARMRSLASTLGAGAGKK